MPFRACSSKSAVARRTHAVSYYHKPDESSQVQWFVRVILTCHPCHPNVHGHAPPHNQSTKKTTRARARMGGHECGRATHCHSRRREASGCVCPEHMHPAHENITDVLSIRELRPFHSTRLHEGKARVIVHTKRATAPPRNATRRHRHRPPPDIATRPTPRPAVCAEV